MSADIPAGLVKELRDRTGAGFSDCKRALVDSGGDMEKAVDILRTRGLADAAKRAGTAAGEGLVEAYLHQTDPDLPPKIGVMVELNCQTDFVAKSPEFRTLAREIALQVAAMRPRWVSKDQVTQDVLDRERQILMASDIVSGKPPAVVEKIVEGKLASLMTDPGGALLEQSWWRDEKQTVGEMVQEVAAKVKENVLVRRFVRFRVGEVD
jgi:elongation factor Ts